MMTDGRRGPSLTKVESEIVHRFNQFGTISYRAANDLSDESRTVDAGIVARILSRGFTGALISLENIILRGGLVIDASRVLPGVIFKNCTFLDFVIMKSTSFSSLTLQSCNFLQSFSADYTTFNTKLYIADCQFRSGASFFRSLFREELLILNCVISRLTFYKTDHLNNTTLQETTFDGLTQLDEVNFYMLRISGCVFTGPVYISEIQVDSKAEVYSSKIGKVLSLRGSGFAESLQFGQNEFSGDFDITNCVTAGTVDLSNCSINGDFSATEVVVGETLRLYRCEFRANLSIYRLMAMLLEIRDTDSSERSKINARVSKVVISSVRVASAEEWRLIAGDVDLSTLLIESVSPLELLSERLYARQIIAKSLHLVISCPGANFASSSFTEGCFIEGARQFHLQDRRSLDEEFVNSIAFTRLPVFARLRIQLLKLKLAREAASAPTVLAPGISDLSYSRLIGLSLSNISLDGCRLSLAHDIDELRLETTSCFKTSQELPVGIAARFSVFRTLQTRRRILWDETAFYKSRGRGNSYVKPDTIARCYRSLRKGLEDSRNSPGAADFYYGEMQMRRRAASSVADSLLLNTYWLISGYGLRAWRAVALLCAFIAVVAALLTTFDLALHRDPDGQARPLPGEPLSYLEAVTFVLRDGSIIFRQTGSSGISLNGAGTFLDLAARLVIPALLGLIALAIRGRVKR